MPNHFPPWNQSILRESEIKPNPEGGIRWDEGHVVNGFLEVEVLILLFCNISA
jgi:hypothetical protein